MTLPELTTAIRAMATADLARDEPTRSTLWFTLRKAGYLACRIEGVYVRHVARLQRRKERHA